MNDSSHTLLCQLEAILFAHGDLMAKDDLLQLMPHPDRLDELLHSLENHYANRGIRLVCVNDCWGFRTASDYRELLTRWQRKPLRLSQAALEILIMCAYHQPLSRAEMEAIRGTAVSSSVLNKLVELGWMKPAGRKSLPGKPLLWETTQAFLEHFDLKSLDHLPSRDEIRSLGLGRGEEGGLFAVKMEGSS